MSTYLCNDLIDSEWCEWAKDVRNWVKGKTGCQTVNFFKDGIIDEEVFSKSRFRPLFILKEVHDKGAYTEELQDIRETDIKNGETMWRKIVTLAREMYKIHSGNGDESFEIIRISRKEEEDSESEYELYKKIAVINLKKASGGNNANSDASKNTVNYECHACEYREKLRHQIDLINPSVIICCSTYEDLKSKVYGPDFTQIENITIEGYHPARNSNAKFYEEVLTLYRAMLENNQ